MKQNKRTKLAAIFLLLIFTYNLFYPSLSYALTSGPTASHLTSYEEFNTTEMVNPLTGDLTYNLPLMEVPAVGANFPVNLFYNAGIKTNQDASDCGLGWGINIGEINRFVNGFPDDYKKETFIDEHNGWSEGLPKTRLIDNNDGISQMDSKLGMSTEVMGTGPSSGISTHQNSSLSRAEREGGGLYKYNNDGTYTKINRRTKFDKSKFIQPYGALYLGHYAAPSSYTGTSSYYGNYASPFTALTSTIPLPNEGVSQMDVIKDINAWSSEVNPELSHIAFDDYVVNAPGISGQIKPEIYENASLIPQSNSEYEKYVKKNSFSALPPITGTIAWNPSNQSVKETNYGFRYTNEFASTLEMPGGSMYIPGNDNTPDNLNASVEPVIQSGTSGFFDPIADNPTNGYASHRLKGKRFIEWFTDFEIKKNFGKAPLRYSDQSTPVEDQNKIIMNAIQYMNNDPTLGHKDYTISNFNYSVINYWVGKFDAVKIKAFKITAEDGTVYHFGLPAYALNEAVLYLPQNSNAPNDGCTVFEKSAPYAYTWLLTGITGPDFIDNNHNGITDANDAGYWVRFDYGKWTDTYEWKAPYENGMYDDDVISKDKMDSHGQKQLFYLNQIVTKTHTAMFIHSERLDGKGADILNSGNAKAKQLKVNEIRLVKNIDLSILRGDIPQFNYTSTSGAHSDSDHHYNEIYDMDDIYGNTLIRQRMKDISLKTVQFDYSYDLCKNTPNSDDPSTNAGGANHGKLTLKKVTSLGKNETGVFPPYLFDYAKDDILKNPNYGHDKYDRWGYYKYDFNGSVPASNNRYVTEDVIVGTTVQTFGSKNYVDAWSLRTITNPLGGKIDIKYESDTYSSVSGLEKGVVLAYNAPSTEFFVNTSYSYPVCFWHSNTIAVSNAILLNQLFYSYSNNKPVKIMTSNHLDEVNAVDWSTGCPSTIDYSGGADELKNLTVTNVDFANSLVTFNVTNLNTLAYQSGGDFTGKSQIKSIIFDQIISPAYKIAFGGGIRVKEVNTIDENTNTYKTLYDYSFDADYSSGFTGAEPPHYDKTDPEFSKYVNDPTSAVFDGPSAMVLYSKVKIKTLKTGIDIPIKTIEYNFEAFDKTQHFNRVFSNPTNYSKQVITTNKLNQVGRLLAQKEYGKNGDLISSIKYEYENAPLDKQGMIKTVNNSSKNTGTPYVYITESVPHTEFSYTGWYLTTAEDDYYPNVLKKIIAKNGPLTTSNTFSKFDFYTGNIIENSSQDPNDGKVLVKAIPAYYKYPDMGSKFDNVNSKNMLIQPTGNYSYSINENNNQELIKADIHTWSSDWNYRERLTNSTTYADISPTNNLFYTSTNPYIPVWRNDVSYIWKSLVNSDGTVNSFVDFVWVANSQNTGWQKTGEISKYNHNSKAIETIDINNRFASIKFGYDDSYVIATAGNAKYTSFGYSGAEDRVGSTNFYGGEVEGGGGEFLSSTYAHTGNYCLRNYTNIDGFKFGGSVGSAPTFDFKKGQKIRASVWLYHSTTPPAGKLLYELYASNGITLVASDFVDITSSSTKVVGSKWYLLTLDFTIPASTTGTTLIVKTTNIDSPPVYFDDFRVHPQEAIMTATVYDAATGWITAALDTDNFATKYYYDASGRLVRTDKETLQGFKKVSENTYHYGRPIN